MPGRGRVQAPDHGLHLLTQLRPRARHNALPGDENHIAGLGPNPPPFAHQRQQQETRELPHAALGEIALDGSAHAPRRREAHPRGRVGPLGARSDSDDQTRAHKSAAGPV